MSSYVAIFTTRTNRQIIKYRGKWLHWERKRGCVDSDIAKWGMKERVIKDNTQENFEDTKNTMAKRKRTKGPSTIYKTTH